ncbi:MAG: bifunctional phosphoribosylaminoimidazolecarboxamide formyltransferase/IMP cyclohydrolase [Pseudanabaenaceae cyanobacterium SKYGB_i_bin29]|nr:bifunctional phosphoribosylaminoimidazolecarboxamide formyltransferase/IMP cyclohydrolase [Pseudanabaenaceae cyanobacterium SKYG29]MDW8420493.1 bifunctional phosphoribosylaminoimidazolecarboxamide formyltransferase/IMP cyclohydrolase [Pseudanabaenaceae cyanobacterium SKYGB_i_bin29]
MTKLALLSVADKTGIVELARVLTDRFHYQILSSGGTAEVLQAAGIAVTRVSDYTGAPEILGGRVKTLHPKIHGGILARLALAEDVADLQKEGIAPIDLVVVNLYPFQQTIAQAGVTEAEAIEQIDIGGPALLRAAAKNFHYVTVLCQPCQYNRYLKYLEQGGTTLEFRRELAIAVFEHTQAYDRAISNYLSGTQDFVVRGTNPQPLRYGENPHQQATWYQTSNQGWSSAILCQGKELSYNNLLDLEAARALAAEFVNDRPTTVIIKHTNPCGVAQGETLQDSYLRALAADPVSAFGGIVALTRTIDVPTAQELTRTFLECVVAPGAEPAALTILQQKPNLRVLLLSDFTQSPSELIKCISGGFLVQTADTIPVATQAWETVTDIAPSAHTLADLVFAWQVCRHVKSNAIVIAKAGVTVGIGAGQMNRVGAVEIALKQAGEKAQGAVLASDGFFPFDDSVRTAAQAGITAIVQPGGSIRDRDSIKAANELGIAMVFTKVRHFLH